MSNLEGSVDLVLNLKGQPQAVQGVTQFSQAVTAAGSQTQAALQAMNKTATQATASVSQMGAAVAQMGQTGTAAAGGVNRTSQAVAALTQVANALSSQTQALTQLTNNLTTSLHGAANAGSMVGEAFKGAFAAGLITEGIRSITGALEDFIKGSLDSAISGQRIEQSLKFATGSALEGAQAFQYLRSESYRLGLDLPTVATEFGRLAAAAKGTSLQGRDTYQVFTGMAEAATVLHMSSAQTGEALLALQQMISKGKVEAQELTLQLGNALPGAFNHAATAMGVTTAELMKMMQQGKLLAEDFLPKFGLELHNAFGKQAEEASQLGLASMQRFKTALFELSASFGTGFLSGVTNALNHVREIFQSDEFKARIKSFGELLGGTLSGLVNHFDSLLTAAEAFFAMFAVAKLAAVVQGIQAMGVALAAVIAMNPILAALTITVGIGVVAFKEAANASHAWHDELIKGESTLKKYADAADPIAAKIKKIHDAQISGGLTLLPAAAAPKKEAPLSDVDQAELLKLQHENTKNMLEATLEGFALKRAIEEAQHRWDVEKFAGKNQLLEAENRRHISEMGKISKEESDARDKNDAEVNKRIDKAAFSEAKLLERQKNEETRMIEEENRKKSHFDEEYARKTMALDKEITHSKLAFASDAADAIGKFTGQAKIAFFAQKAIAASSIILNSLMAQAAAVAPPPIGAGPIAGLGLIPKLEELMAFELAGVAAQSLQGFADGGFIAGRSTYGDKNIIRANAGEVVLTPSQQREFMAMAKGQGNGGGGNTVHVTYAPVYPSGPHSGGQSFTDMARKEMVEFGRFIEKELRPKGYIT